MNLSRARTALAAALCGVVEFYFRVCREIARIIMAAIRLDWPANPAGEYVSAYKVWESVNGGAWALKATVATNSLDIPDPSPHPTKWKVQAVNFVGESAASAEAVGPGIPSVPPAPSIQVIA